MRERCTQQEQQSTLNSTVILLILGEERGKRVLVLDFKFHCDSINITAEDRERKTGNNFKFHCDSINMFAVRRIFEGQFFFKFHCDSINIQVGEAITEAFTKL